MRRGRAPPARVMGTSRGARSSSPFLHAPESSGREPERATPEGRLPGVASRRDRSPSARGGWGSPVRGAPLLPSRPRPPDPHDPLRPGSPPAAPRGDRRPRPSDPPGRGERRADEVGGEAGERRRGRSPCGRRSPRGSGVDWCRAAGSAATARRRARDETAGTPDASRERARETGRFRGRSTRKGRGSRTREEATRQREPARESGASAPAPLTRAGRPPSGARHRPPTSRVPAPRDPERSDARHRTSRDTRPRRRSRSRGRGRRGARRAIPPPRNRSGAPGVGAEPSTRHRRAPAGGGWSAPPRDAARGASFAGPALGRRPRASPSGSRPRGVPRGGSSRLRYLEAPRRSRPAAGFPGPLGVRTASSRPELPAPPAVPSEAGARTRPVGLDPRDEGTAKVRPAADPKGHGGSRSSSP